MYLKDSTLHLVPLTSRHISKLCSSFRFSANFVNKQFSSILCTSPSLSITFLASFYLFDERKLQLDMSDQAQEGLVQGMLRKFESIISLNNLENNNQVQYSKVADQV